MKRYLITIIAITLYNIAFTQLQTGYHYKIKNEYHGIRDTIYYKNGNRTEIKQIENWREWRIWRNMLKASVIQDKIDPSIIRIDFWPITSIDTTLDSIYVVSRDTIDLNHYFYFQLPKRPTLASPNIFYSIPYTTWEFGVTTIPFKYRFGKKSDSIPNQTTASINAGFYIGRKWGKTRFYTDSSRSGNALSFTLAAFASPMIIDLSSKTSRNKVTTESTELGIGVGLAFMFSYRDLNFGILGGYDIPISGESSKWNYAKRPWIGFGIGYKLALLGAGK